MTGYERIRAVLDGRRPDRVPTMLHAFMPAAAEAGITMREYRTSAAAIAKAHISFARKYDLDGILMDIDTCVEASVMGVPVDYPEHEPARVTGAASSDIDALLEMMDPHKLASSERVQVSLEAVRLMKREAGDLFIRGNCDQMAFSLAMLAYGMSDFLADLLDEDAYEDILALMERAYQVHLEYHKLMHQAGADITSFGDSSCGPDLISPALYRQFSYPFQKRLKADLDALGIETICHICGDLSPILEDVVGIGYAAVEADYKTDMKQAAALIKDRSVLFGPIDPSGLFYFGTPEEVAAETRRVLSLFGGHSIVIGAGCALPTGTPEANIRAFVDTAQAFAME